MSAEPTVASPALERLQPSVERTETVVSHARAWGGLSVRELPTAVWLALIVVVSAGVRIALAASMPGPGIFPDEIVYSELAKGIASSGDFLIRDMPYAGWTYGPLYVLLIAPAYWIQSLPDAYLVAKAISAVVMSLAAIPAYFLARGLLDRRAALLAASLTLVLPSLVQSSRVMTESLFLPVFLTTVLAFVTCLERPTGRRQLALVAAITLAILTRAQAVVLVPAFVSAAGLLAWVELRAEGKAGFRPLVQRLARYRLVWFAFAFGSGAGLAVAGARGGWAVSPGNRHEGVLNDLRPLEAPKWILYHIAGLDLAVGILPLAAFFLLARATFRTNDRVARSFFAVAISVTTWLLVMIGLYATKPHVPLFRERYVLYLEPLFLISLLAWLKSERVKTGRLTMAVALACALIPFTLYFGSLFGHVYEAPGLALWVSLRNRAGDEALFLALAALAVGSAYLLLHHRARSSVLASVVALYLAASSLAASATFQVDSRESVAAGVGSGQRDWIDRAVGPRANVAAIWSGREEQWDRYRTIWINEFFNRSVRRIYYFGEVPFDLSETRVRLRDSTAVLPDGQPLYAEYVLSDGPVIVGRRVASQPEAGLGLYRVAGPVRLAGSWEATK